MKRVGHSLVCRRGLSGHRPESLTSPTDQTDRLHDRRTKETVLDGVTVFLDRDGTLNYDPGYLKVAAELKLLAGVGPSLARLKRAGARLVVVTNQSGVGRGIITLKDLEAIHARLQGLLEQEDAALDAIYFCPHHPDDGCRCRKPNVGMVERAVSELQLDLRRSYLIGDHARDIQLATRVGAKAILLATGRWTRSRWRRSRLNRPCRMPWRSRWLRQLTGSWRTRSTARKGATSGKGERGKNREPSGSCTSRLSRISRQSRVAYMMEDYRHILLIKPSSLGDIVHAMPTCAAIRRAYPKARLTWLVKREWAGLVERIDGVDRVWPVESTFKGWLSQVSPPSRRALRSRRGSSRSLSERRHRVAQRIFLACGICQWARGESLVLFEACAGSTIGDARGRSLPARGQGCGGGGVRCAGVSFPHPANRS